VRGEDTISFAASRLRSRFDTPQTCRVYYFHHSRPKHLAIPFTPPPGVESELRCTAHFYE